MALKLVIRPISILGGQTSGFAGQDWARESRHSL